MRIIGLDYGTKTVGVAVSDSLGITAQAVETITRKEENKLRQTLARIEALIDELRKLNKDEYIISKKVLKKEVNSSKMYVEVFFKVYENIGVTSNIVEKDDLNGVSN